MNRIIITVVGKDTVGIIASVCTYLADKQVNILDISQTIVQEYFNMMMIVDIKNCTVAFDELREGLNAIGDDIYWVASGIRSGVRIEYNKALLAASGFEAIPDNLTDYIAMAKKMTEDGAANDPVTYGIGFTSSSPFERQLEMMAQVSGVFYYDYANGRFDFTGYKPFL